MKLDRPDGRRGSSTNARRLQRTSRPTLLFLLLAGLCCQASAQPAIAVGLSASPELSTEEIVEKLVAMDLERSQALHAYQVSEVYRLAYRRAPN
jgi:hypothetical protein